MRYWLMKSEPTTFSWDDLLKSKNRTTNWDGVRNYQARNFMRDDFKPGDGVLFYHSSAEPPCIAGIGEVVRGGYPEKEEPWVMADIKATMSLSHPITREELAKNPTTKSMMVLKRGSRLSIQPVTEAEFRTVMKMGKAKYLS